MVDIKESKPKFTGQSWIKLLHEAGVRLKLAGIPPDSPLFNECLKAIRTETATIQLQLMGITPIPMTSERIQTIIDVKRMEWAAKQLKETEEKQRKDREENGPFQTIQEATFGATLKGRILGQPAPPRAPRSLSPLLFDVMGYWHRMLQESGIEKGSREYDECQEEYKALRKRRGDPLTLIKIRTGERSDPLSEENLQGIITRAILRKDQRLVLAETKSGAQGRTKKAREEKTAKSESLKGALLKLCRRLGTYDAREVKKEIQASPLWKIKGDGKKTRIYHEKKWYSWDYIRHILEDFRKDFPLSPKS